MEIPETDSPPSGTPAPDFDTKMSSALEAVRRGQMPFETLLRLARSRETETLQYCIRRMTNPNLSIAEEIVIARLLQQAGKMQQFVENLLSLDYTSARSMAKLFQNSERGLDLKVAVYLQSDDHNVVMRSLELLEFIGESKQLVPLLFALLNINNPKIQSKAALLIQKLDTELVFTRRLMQHPDPRVRANTLQAIADRADTRGREFLRQGAADPDNRVRTLAAIGLTRIGDPLGIEVLSKMIQHPNAAERRSAAWGLGMCSTPEALSLLEVAGLDTDARVRALAAASIVRVRQQEPGTAGT